MCGQCHTEWQAEKDQRWQLQQAGAAAGKCGKQVGEQGNQKKYELFHIPAANQWRDIIIIVG